MNLVLRNKYVLVTGASGGLGREIARHLAADHGAHLILVARREDRLVELSAELKKAHGTECILVPADLTLAADHGAHLILVARREDRLVELSAELKKAHGTECILVPADLTLAADLDKVFDASVGAPALAAVVLNAGVTYFGDAIDQSDASIEALLQTNVTSVAKLAVRFGGYFRDKRAGAIQLVSSMAGFAAPVPGDVRGVEGVRHQPRPQPRLRAARHGRPRRRLRPRRHRHRDARDLRTLQRLQARRHRDHGRRHLRAVRGEGSRRGAGAQHPGRPERAPRRHDEIRPPRHRQRGRREDLREGAKVRQTSRTRRAQGPWFGSKT
jgi:short-subunit dehydrogenase